MLYNVEVSDNSGNYAVHARSGELTMSQVRIIGNGAAGLRTEPVFFGGENPSIRFTDGSISRNSRSGIDHERGSINITYSSIEFSFDIRT